MGEWLKKLGDVSTFAGSITATAIGVIIVGLGSLGVERLRASWRIRHAVKGWVARKTDVTSALPEGTSENNVDRRVRLNESDEPIATLIALVPDTPLLAGRIDVRPMVRRRYRYVEVSEPRPLTIVSGEIYVLSLDRRPEKVELSHVSNRHGGLIWQLGKGQMKRHHR
jgi:hypothetical protein